MSDLKACPFCGRIPDIEDCGKHRWFIRCKCGIAQDKLFFQKCDAVRAWNKRKELRVKDTNAPITDTISRQAAIDALNQKKIYRPLDSDRYVISDCLNAIVNLPSAEPEIIRCRECKHMQEDKLFGQYWCRGNEVKPDHFCGYAERRADE